MASRIALAPRPLSALPGSLLTPVGSGAQLRRDPCLDFTLREVSLGADFHWHRKITGGKQQIDFAAAQAHQQFGFRETQEPISANFPVVRVL